MRPHETLKKYKLEDAIVKLSKHSFTYDDLNDPEMINGFMGHLRPFDGKLNDNLFHDLMACIKSIGPILSKSENVNRDIVRNFFTIIQFARAWAVYPDGMLRSNNLISNSDVEKMEYWLDCIGYAVTTYMDYDDHTEALQSYDFFMEDQNDN